MKTKKEYTVLVHYKQWMDSGHALLDGGWEERSKVDKCENLEDLNDIYRHILKIDILEVK